MQRHELGGRLPPPTIRPTATHTYKVIYPVCRRLHYFPPVLQLPSQPSIVTALRSVPSSSVIMPIRRHFAYHLHMNGGGRGRAPALTMALSLALALTLVLARSRVRHRISGRSHMFC